MVSPQCFLPAGKDLQEWTAGRFHCCFDGESNLPQHAKQSSMTLGDMNDVDAWLKSR